MADDKVKIDIRRRRQEPTIYEKNSLYLISDIGDENFVLIVTDPEGNPKKIEAEDLSEYAKLTDLPETSTLQELLDTIPEDIGKLQTPFRLNEWADSKYALKNHTHIWGDITDRPTKLTDFQNDLENYGDWITENFADTKYALRTSSITGEGSLEGGGDLTQDRTIDLKDETKTDIGLGVEANSWGDHKTEGYLKDNDLDGYATEDWVEGKGYITSYEDTTYTAGEGLDLVGNEFSLTQSVTDALEEAHTHPNKNILDSILQVDLDNWNEAYSKAHTHANKAILDGISSSDIEDWEEAYDKKVNAISFTGDTNKTLTVTREDGSILTASFLDNNDPQFPDDVLNTLTFNDNNDGVLRAITSEGSIIDVSLDGRYSLLGHKHVWEDITDRPTSLSDFTNDLGNYGNWITKAQGDDWYEPIFSKNSAFNKNFGTGNDDVARGNHTHATLTAGAGLTGDSYNGGTARTWSFDTDWGDNRYGTKTFISNAIDDIEIGGRNYIRTHVSEWTEITISGNNSGGASTPNIIEESGKQLSEMRTNQLYTFSVEIKNNSAPIYCSVRWYDGNNSISFTNTGIVENGIIKFTHIKPTNANRFIVRFASDVGGDKTFEYRKFKLEVGNKATDWTPAPEDQVSDWNETNPDSFSFLKNKPLDDIAKGVTAHGWGNHAGKYLSNTITYLGYTELFSGDLNTLPNGNYVQAISGSSTNGASGIGTPRSLISFGARDSGDTILQSDILIGTEGFAVRNRGNNTWRTAWHTSNLSDPATETWSDGRFALRTRTITGTGSLTGGGNLTANRTLDLTATAKSDIAKGVTANGWGNHAGKYLSLDGGKLQDSSATILELSRNGPYNQVSLKFSTETQEMFFGLGTDGKLRLKDDNNISSGGDTVATESWVNSQSSLQNYYTKTESLNQFVGLSGVQDIADTKTFLNSPVVPNPTLDAHAVNRGWVRDSYRNDYANLVGVVAVDENNDVSLNFNKEEVNLNVTISGDEIILPAGDYYLTGFWGPSFGFLNKHLNLFMEVGNTLIFYSNFYQTSQITINNSSISSPIFTIDGINTSIKIKANDLLDNLGTYSTRFSIIKINI